MFKLIVSAVKAAWRALKAAAAFSLKAIGAIGGGGTIPEIEEADTESLEAENTDSIAALIMSWAVGCVRLRTMKPAPMSLPTRYRTWLESLDLKEAVLVVDAGRVGIKAHISGGALEGVPPHDLAPSIIPAWRQAHATLRDAAMDRSERWRKIRRVPMQASSDVHRPQPALVEGGERTASPATFP